MKSNVNQLYISSDTHKRRINDIQKFYDLYHRVYLEIWGDYENLAIHMGYYDEKVSCHKESMIRMNQIVCETADIHQSDLVLDAGCGVGGTSIWLANTIGCNVTGISLVENEINSAKKFSNLKQMNHLTHFETMDIINTKFEEESFDVIIAIESICYIIDKSKFLNEAFRVLKKGGRLIIADYFCKDGSISKEEKYQLDQICQMSIIDLCSIKYFEDLLSFKNFIDINPRDISVNIKRSYEEGILNLSQLHILNSKYLRKHIEEEKSRNLLEYQCLTNKLLRYGLVYAKKP